MKLKKIPDNSPEAQDLQDLTIQYEFSENFHYAKIERDYVNPVEKYLLDNKDNVSRSKTSPPGTTTTARTRRCPSTKRRSRLKN